MPTYEKNWQVLKANTLKEPLKKNTLLKTNVSPQKRHFWVDDFPFPVWWDMLLPRRVTVSFSPIFRVYMGHGWYFQGGKRLLRVFAATIFEVRQQESYVKQGCCWCVGTTSWPKTIHQTEKWSVQQLLEWTRKYQGILAYCTWIRTGNRAQPPLPSLTCCWNQLSSKNYI